MNYDQIIAQAQERVSQGVNYVKENPAQVVSVASGLFVFGTFVAMSTTLTSFIYMAIFGIIYGTMTCLMMMLSLKIISSIFTNETEFI